MFVFQTINYHIEKSLKTNIETLSKQVSELLNANLRDFFESEDVTTLTPDFARNMILLIHKLVLQIGGLTFKQFTESYDIEQDKFMEDGLVYRKKYKSCRSITKNKVEKQLK